MSRILQKWLPLKVIDEKPRPGYAGSLLQIAFIVFAYLLIVFASEFSSVKTLSIVSVSIVLEALPFMLLGAVIGGLLEVFLSRETIVGFLPRNKVSTVLVAAALGFFMPLCECAVVPVVRRLLRKGVPFSAALAYLLAAPIVNPIVVASTLVAYSFDYTFALLRLVLGYAIATSVALMVAALLEPEQALLKDGKPLCSHSHSHSSCEDESLGRRLHRALIHGGEDFFDVGRYLIMGAFTAAFIQSFVSRQSFLVLSSEPILAIILMMAFAICLNLCSEADGLHGSWPYGGYQINLYVFHGIQEKSHRWPGLYYYSDRIHRNALTSAAMESLMTEGGTNC